MYAITFDLLTEDLLKVYPKFTDRVKGAKRLPRNKRSLIEE